MARKTNVEKIAELEKKLSMYEEIVERVEKRNKELVDAEEHTFLHSPSYLQMKEHISWIENLNKLCEYNITSTKKNAKKIDVTIQQIYEDNKRLTEEHADIEYFVGITENWREAWEFKKLQDQILELQAKVEQKEQAVTERDVEIHRLQLQLAEETLCKQKQEKLYEKFCKTFGGKIIDLNVMGTSTVINPLAPVLRVFGTGKEEFVDKMSDIYKVSVVEKTEDYIQIVVHEDFSFDETAEKKKEFISLCKSMWDKVQYQVLN